MPYRNWLYEAEAITVVPAALALAIIIATTLVLTSNHAFRTKSQYGDNAIRDQSGAAKSVHNAATSSSNGAVCDRSRNAKDDDLCQQWRMAEAAEEAVFLSKIQAIVGFFGLAGLLLTVIYAARAADAASRSAKVAERSLIELERALVLPESFSVYSMVRRQEVFAFRIIAVLTNIGNSTAKKFVGTANIVVLDEPMREDFVFPDRKAADPVATSIGRGVKTTFPIDIAIQDVVDIQHGRKFGYFYGWVEYDDIFSVSGKRRTEYCAQIGVESDPAVIPTEGSTGSVLGFKSHGRYNETDSDCVYKPGERPPVGGLPPPTQPPVDPEQPG